MKAKYRIGLVGLAHNHVWHVLEPLENSDLCELVAATVENPSNDSLLEERQKKQKQMAQ